MIIVRTWYRYKWKGKQRKYMDRYTYEGWFLFGFIPMFIRIKEEV